MPRSLPLSGQVTLTQLGYVVAVDTHRHFGRAAAACHVTQPTLSAQLAKLERALGLALFDRARTPVEPTEAGRLVAAQARAVLREAARLDEVRGALAGAVAGEVRLGVIPTLAPYALPPLLPLLRARHPGLELVVEERLTDDLLAAVRAGALDAALVATAAGGGDLAERVLFAEPFVGYVSAGHRLAGRAELAREDLAPGDVWLLGEGHCLRGQAVALCRGRARGAPAAAARFESGNLETLARLVEAGDGMTLLPALAAASLRTDAQRALVRPFRAPAPARAVRLVQPRLQRRAALVGAVADAVLDVVRPVLEPEPGGPAVVAVPAPRPPRPPRRAR